jgi:hypothetical protein
MERLVVGCVALNPCQLSKGLIIIYPFDLWRWALFGNDTGGVRQATSGFEQD